MSLRGSFMLGNKSNKSAGYIIGILSPAIVAIAINLYGLLFHYSNRYTEIVTNILLIFMFFNIGLRDIIVKKSKFGYLVIILAVILLWLFYKHL